MASSIFQADDAIRSKRREAFEPRKIALGPYHRSWSPVDQLKDRVFRQVVERSRRTSVEYSSAMQRVEAEASKCYRWVGPSPPSEAFRSMLLYDGCFLLEIISGKILSSFPYVEHQQMLIDVMKLENQIPMVVLRELYQLEHRNDRVEELLLGFIFKPNYTGMLGDLLQKMHDASHVLDAMRIKMFPMMTTRAEPGPFSLQKGTSVKPGLAFSVLYSATELLDAQIILSPNNSGAVEWVETSSTLTLPVITVGADMDTLFLNMVAFERGTGDWRQPAASYLRFLGDLMRTDDDVRALRANGILINSLPTDDSAIEFFKQLKLGETYDLDMLSGVRMAVNARCSSSKIAPWVRIERACFKQPWPTHSLAVVAGMLLLLQAAHLIRFSSRSRSS